jgi:hypothetical protein
MTHHTSCASIARSQSNATKKSFACATMSQTTNDDPHRPQDPACSLTPDQYAIVIEGRINPSLPTFLSGFLENEVHFFSSISILQGVWIVVVCHDQRGALGIRIVVVKRRTVEPIQSHISVLVAVLPSTFFFGVGGKTADCMRQSHVVCLDAWKDFIGSSCLLAWATVSNNQSNPIRICHMLTLLPPRFSSSSIVPTYHQ